MKKIIAGILVAGSVFSFSSAALAAAVPPASVSVSIDASSLVAGSGKQTLSGIATGTSKLKVEIRKQGSEKVLCKKFIKVSKGAWKFNITKKLPEGSYDVLISASAKGNYVKNIASGTLVIGEGGSATTVMNAPKANSMSGSLCKTSSTLVVSPIALLSGGNAKAGATVPVSYLQINNTGKEPIEIKGFWMKQNGTADARSVVGLSTVDGDGGSRGMSGGIKGQTPFKDGLGYVSTIAILLPGQMKLFTIKAILSGDASAYAGKNLMLDVASVETSGVLKGSFPIRGTTWTISK